MPEKTALNAHSELCSSRRHAHLEHESVSTHTAASLRQQEALTPASLRQQEALTPASLRQQQSLTPASLRQQQSLTPASLRQQQASTPASLRQQQASTPASLGQQLHIDAPATSSLPRTHPLTPLNAQHFAHELQHHPDQHRALALIQGLQVGVRLGYSGPRRHFIATNLPSARQRPEVIDQELQKECKAGRILGPFSTLPLPRLHCSGLGAVPKKNGKWRMIMHLSAPLGNSINDGIEKDEYSLQYSSIDDAVRFLLELGVGAQMAKVDLKSAFRMVPVHRDDWELLGISWKGNFYVDTCLPFGLRSAPYLFNEVADAIEWITRNNYSIPHVLHYLDDYFIAGPPHSSTCQEWLDRFLRVATHLGAWIAAEKVEGPTTQLDFLGLTLDSVRREIRLPPGKLQELLSELNQWSSRTKTTKRKLLSLIGKLSFAARAVPAGRLFLRRLISLSTTVTRPHHHIWLSDEARADIHWWISFLPSWNGTAKFINPTATPATDINLYRCSRLTRLWCLLPRGLVSIPVATSPGPYVNPVEGALCHCGSHPDLGSPLARTASQVLL